MYIQDLDLAIQCAGFDLFRDFLDEECELNRLLLLGFVVSVRDGLAFLFLIAEHQNVGDFLHFRMTDALAQRVGGSTKLNADVLLK